MANKEKCGALLRGPFSGMFAGKRGGEPSGLRKLTFIRGPSSGVFVGYQKKTLILLNVVIEDKTLNRDASDSVMRPLDRRIGNDFPG